MGCVVIHPTTPGYMPTPEILDRLMTLLRAEEIVDTEVEPSTWTDGPQFHRLGLPMGSQPMILSVRIVDETCDPAEVEEEWERTLAQQHFYLSIQDSQPAVVRSDSIWGQMEQALGTPLATLYFHI